MKKIIAILMMLAVGGYAMTKQEWKDKLFFDASDPKAACKLETAQGILKEDLIKKYGFTEKELITIAKEYNSNYKKNINGANLLDYELRKVANMEMSYFQAYDFKQALSEKKSAMPDWLRYTLIGLGVLVGGFVVYKVVRKRKLI